MIKKANKFILLYHTAAKQRQKMILQSGQKLQKCFAGAKWTCIFNKNGNIYKRFCQGMYILTKEP